MSLQPSQQAASVTAQGKLWAVVCRDKCYQCEDHMAEDNVTLKCGLRGLNVGNGVLIQVTFSPVIDREAPLFQPSDHSLYQEAWAQMEIAPAKPGMKWCPDCGDWRPHSYFDADSSRGDGLRGYCREHQRERDHARYVKRTEGLRRDERRSRANVRGRNRK